MFFLPPAFAWSHLVVALAPPCKKTPRYERGMFSAASQNFSPSSKERCFSATVSCVSGPASILARFESGSVISEVSCFFLTSSLSRSGVVRDVDDEVDPGWVFGSPGFLSGRGVFLLPEPFSGEVTSACLGSCGGGAGDSTGGFGGAPVWGVACLIGCSPVLGAALLDLAADEVAEVVLPPWCFFPEGNVGAT